MSYPSILAKWSAMMSCCKSTGAVLLLKISEHLCSSASSPANCVCQGCPHVPSTRHPPAEQHAWEQNGPLQLHSSVFHAASFPQQMSHLLAPGWKMGKPPCGTDKAWMLTLGFAWVGEEELHFPGKSSRSPLPHVWGQGRALSAPCRTHSPPAKKSPLSNVSVICRFPPVPHVRSANLYLQM